MKLAASKLKDFDMGGSALQWAHHRLAMILATGKLPPAFTPLASRSRVDSRINPSSTGYLEQIS